MITEQNEKMLALLSDALHNRTPNPISEEDWLTIFEEMKVQTVFALPAEKIGAVGLNETALKQYTSAIGQNLQNFYTVLETQQEVLDLLHKEGIPVVVLKGAAAAMNYPHPASRCMGDVDVIVQPADFERAYHALSTAGFQPEESLDDYQRHIGFRSECGISIELHNYFSTSSTAVHNQYLDNRIYSAIPQANFVELYDYTLSVLPPLENGLVLLAHINHHLPSGLGLRQIIDWMCYVEKYLDDTFWTEAFSSAADSIGLRQLAEVATAMCQKYLGLLGSITWCKYEPICDELMEYILNHGNFGSKDRAKFTTVSIVRYFRNPIVGLRKAQEFGLVTWKALRKHPWLKPFAWLYQICRWISHGIKHGVSTSALLDASSVEDSETDFLKRLGNTRL